MQKVVKGSLTLIREMIKMFLKFLEFLPDQQVFVCHYFFLTVQVQATAGLYLCVHCSQGSFHMASRFTIYFINQISDLIYQISYIIYKISDILY